MRGLREERHSGNGREWRARARDRGMEMVGAGGGETGSMTKKGKQKSAIGIGANVTPDYRGK